MVFTQAAVASNLFACRRPFRVVNIKFKIGSVNRALNRSTFTAITGYPKQVTPSVQRYHKLRSWRPQPHRRVMQKSQRADPEGGVSIRKGKWRVELVQLAAAEEAIAVGELGVVLDSSLLRPTISRGRSELTSGGLGPLLDRIGEAVVHLEAEDVIAIA